MHQRASIRHAAKAALLNQTAAGANVFTSRAYPYDPAGGPGVMIYTTDENSQLDSMGSRRGLVRELNLAIEVVAAVNETLDDTFDAIAAEIERALGGNNTLNGTAKDLELRRTQIAFVKDGEKATGVMVLTFAVTYRTQATVPTELA